MGKFQAGSKNPKAKLRDPRDRAWALKQLAAGVPKTVLGKKLGVGPKALWELEHGRSFKSDKRPRKSG